MGSHSYCRKIFKQFYGCIQNRKATCISDLYSSYQPVSGYYVNGVATLGENIADFGGVKHSYLAYKQWLMDSGEAELRLSKSFTNDQLFWIVLGQTWCTKASRKRKKKKVEENFFLHFSRQHFSKTADLGIVKQLLSDEHSPSKYRVNGPLSNTPEFSNSFSCPPGSKMNPTQKCSLW